MLSRVGVPRHADAGDDQEGTEDEWHPPKRFEECATDGNQDAAQDDRHDDAPEQGAITELVRYSKRCEEDREHGDVVDREAVLDEVSRKEFRPDGRSEHHPDGDAECDPEPTPDAGPNERLARGDFLIALVEDEKIQDQRRNDDDGQSNPKQRGVIHQYVPLIMPECIRSTQTGRALFEALSCLAHECDALGVNHGDGGTELRGLLFGGARRGDLRDRSSRHLDG